MYQITRQHDEMVFKQFNHGGAEYEKIAEDQEPRPFLVLFGGPAQNPTVEHQDHCGENLVGDEGNVGNPGGEKQDDTAEEDRGDLGEAKDFPGPLPGVQVGKKHDGERRDEIPA